jgi:hypothetical protein
VPYLSNRGGGNMKSIYIDVTSYNFWWGIYGLSENVSWEDVRMYSKQENDFIKVFGFCLCSKSYFKDYLIEYENDDDERDYYQKAEGFVNNENVVYHYYYDDLSDEDFFEVPFEAPRNKNGIKPRSIELWNPSQSINEDVLLNSVKIFCDDFVNLEIEIVEWKEKISFDDALEAYIDFCKQTQNGISFSDELVEQLSKEWNLSKDGVLDKLQKNI